MEALSLMTSWTISEEYNGFPRSIYRSNQPRMTVADYFARSGRTNHTLIHEHIHVDGISHNMKKWFSMPSDWWLMNNKDPGKLNGLLNSHQPFGAPRHNPIFIQLSARLEALRAKPSRGWSIALNSSNNFAKLRAKRFKPKTNWFCGWEKIPKAALTECSLKWKPIRRLPLWKNCYRHWQHREICPFRWLAKYNHRWKLVQKELRKILWWISHQGWRTIQ